MRYGRHWASYAAASVPENAPTTSAMTAISSQRENTLAYRDSREIEQAALHFRIVGEWLDHRRRNRILKLKASGDEGCRIDHEAGGAAFLQVNALQRAQAA